MIAAYVININRISAKWIACDVIQIFTRALQVRAVSVLPSAASPIAHSGAPIASIQAKYLDFLARYYVLKRQHMLAAHILLRLSERRSSTDAGDGPSLEQRLIVRSFILPLSLSLTNSFATFYCAVNLMLLHLLLGCLTT